ncbi:peptidoglycan DD-metalloendopeptidase family protein [Streptomyces harbinensis]|uniref:M23 family metallopeptidase n=1 Tax=Streptomyces TaxID=1883 RepID=UPI00131A3E3A|nr:MULTISPECIES: M23 family metallopeptidase [Streptomyces]QKV69476.1 peptidoglycan DD-metalloendopeptidase family protein [Streptomyces harbinensis]
MRQRIRTFQRGVVLAVVLAAAAPVVPRAVAKPPVTAESLTEEVRELRAEAADASATHERLRRRQLDQRAELAEVRERLDAERERLSALRDIAGQRAREQYRTGSAGSGGLARLILADSPDIFLRRVSLLERGDLAARRLLDEVLEAEAALARDELLASRTQAKLRQEAERQREIREEVERKLAAAEARLTELRELQAEREARASRAARQRAAAPLPAPPAPAGGDCVSAVRDADELAQPAGGGASWVAPVETYTLSASFAQHGGMWSSAHTGQDFAVPTGTPVRAVGSGMVVSVTCGDAFGNAVIIDHGNGYYSQYAHLSVTEVAQGQYIAVGQRLGRSGSTGNSTGPHLHFEIRLTPYVGSAIDPAPWLRDHGVTL